MNILFLGPQGSGKGTQANLLADKYNLFYFDTGFFLRELAKSNNLIKETLSKGKLVPDKDLISSIEAFFDEKQIYDNIIFDGFPRTTEQYLFFKEWLTKKNIKIDFAFVLNISEKTTIKRLSGRRIDTATGKIYNLVTDKPPASIDKSNLIQREDDKPEAIKKRLDIYKVRTMPLINELKKDIKTFEINAEKPINEIHKEIVGIIENKKKK